MSPSREIRDCIEVDIFSSQNLFYMSSIYTILTQILNQTKQFDTNEFLEVKLSGDKLSCEKKYLILQYCKNYSIETCKSVHHFDHRLRV